MIERISHNELLLAIVIRHSYKQDGISFFTDNNFSQQLGYMNRPKGYSIEPHRHKLVSREVVQTQEVLIVKSGKVRVDFYDDDQNYLESLIIETGDVILLAAGGHGFEMLEPTEMIEVKQGPYVSDRDKVRFESVSSSDIRLK